MDLFSLVARLTLDEKDYEKALKQAERKASSAKVDVSGEIRVADHFSDALQRVESAAQNFDGDVSGEITANDQYTGKVEAAETKADEADLDADGKLSADDQYSGDLSAAVTAAADAFLDAEGTLSADDDYTEALEGAENDAAVADLDADGALTADDDYTEVLEGAENDAAVADLDAEGTITLDTSDVSESLEEAETATSDFESHLTDMVDSLQSKLKAAGIALTIRGIASAFQGALRDTAQYSDTVDKGAQALSISRKEYQKWDYALAQSGASIGTITRGFKNLNSFLGGEATDDINAAMEALQINPEDYKGTEDLFAAVVGTLAEMEEGSERDNLVTALFGRNGVQLNALLNSGKDGIEELREEAERLGMVLSDEDIANAVTYGDALSRMNRTIDGLKMRVMTALMPVLTEAADQVAELVPELENAMKTGDWQPFFDKFNQGIGKIFQGIGQAIGIVNVDGTLNLPGWLKTAIEGIKVAIDFVGSIVSWIGDFLGLSEKSRNEEQIWQYYKEHPGAVRVAPPSWDVMNPTEFLTASDVYDFISEMLGPDYIKNHPNDWQEVLPYIPLEMDKEKRGIKSVDRDAFLSTLPATLRDDVRDVSELNLPAGADAFIPDGAVYADGANVTADGAYILADGTIVIPNAVGAGVTKYNPDGTVTTSYNSRIKSTNPVVWSNTHAKGLWDVPYDNYLAALHRDEMVLTASQARDYREGKSDSDALLDVIQQLRNDMTNLKIQVGEKVFGQTVVDYSGRKMRGYIGRAEDRVISGYGWG